MQLKNAVEVGDFCRRDYIYWPLSSNKRLVFEELIRHVKGPDVLDLGCGEAGLYWSMGYVLDAGSINFYDINQSHLDGIAEQLESISPEAMEEHFQETVEYLRENAMVPDDVTYEELAAALVEKVDQIQCYNFKTDEPSKSFDTVLCVESLQVAHTQDELEINAANVAKLLKPGGQILGISWVYNQFNDHTKHLVSLQYDGMLNPTEENFDAAFTKVGLRKSILKTLDTPDINNYHKAVVYAYQKPEDAA